MEGARGPVKDGEHRPETNYTINQTQQNGARLVLQPSTSPTFHHGQMSTNVQTENAKSLNPEATIYSVNRYVSTHQITYCKSSNPEAITRLSSLQSTPSAPVVVTSRALRVTRVSDSFVESLRKYPALPPDCTRSSDLIDKLLSATLSKRVNQTKKTHTLTHSKKHKSLIEHSISKNASTHPRVKRVAAVSRGNVKAESKPEPSSLVKACMTPTSTTVGLRDISPRVQRMGRGAEVRYINDVKKCIRDAIKHVWNEEDTVCPEIQRRYAIHQKEYHSPSKNIGCGTYSNNPENQLPSTSRASETTNNHQGVCCQCNKLPCECQMKTVRKPKEDSQTATERSFGRCLKFCDQNTSHNTLNTISCCQFCREEQDVYGDTFKQVNEWLQEIPVNANYTCDDKEKRQVIIKKLVLSLVRCKGVEDKQKMEIKKCLDILPMWQPADLYDRDAFRNNLIENLLKRLRPYENNNLDSITKLQEENVKSQGISKTSRNDTDVNKSMLLDATIKDDIKRILEITKNNHLDPKTESLLMEALIIKLKILSTPVNLKSGSGETTQNKANNGKQNVQETLAQKVSQVLGELPLNVGQNIKKVMKDEIMDVILKKLDDGQKFETDTVTDKIPNQTNTDFSLNATTSLSETSTTREQIQKYVNEYISDLFREYALDVKSYSNIQNNLTNIITDQIMRGDSENKFKEKAYSLLQEINLPKSKTEDLLNTILHDTNDMTLSFKNKTLPSFQDKLSKSPLKQNNLKNIEKEIINFITDITGSFDTRHKQQVISSTKYLTERIENIVSNTKRSNKEKEDLIHKAIFNFMKSKGLPTNGRCKKFATNLTKLLLNTQPKSSTLQETGHDKHFYSSTLSSIECEESLNKLEQTSLVQIYENISLNSVSQEVLKCIEKIPSDRVISRDKNYHKIIAKEIAKRIRSTTNQSSNPNLVLEQIVTQWLPKYIKEPNRTEFNQLKDNLKKIMKQNILPDKNNTDELIVTLKTGMMDWLRNTPMYRRRNTEERLFQENLVSNLASELNQLINNVKSDQNMIDEELLLRTIENRIKQFPMDPRTKFDNNYHHNIAVELLNHLKATEAIPNIISSSLNIITQEVLKLTKKIPPHRLISRDPKHQRMLAKEIAKQIKEKVDKSSNPDLVIGNEVQQWLPKVMKEPTESEMRRIADEFVKIIKPNIVPNVPVNVTQQFDEILKDAITEWLRNHEIYQRRNTEEKLAIENLMSDLADDLCEMLDNLKPNQNDAHKALLKSIENRIKQLPLDPIKTHNEEYHRKIALQLLNHLQDLGLLNKVSEENGELETTISSWIQKLPLKREMNSQELAELGANIQSILSEFLNNATPDTEKHLKQRIITKLKYLPIKDDFCNEDKLLRLVDSLLGKLSNRLVNDNIRQSLEREVAFRCEGLSIDTGNKPEDIKKIQQLKENLTKGLVNIIDKLNTNPDIIKNDALYENIVKDEIEHLLYTLSIDGYISRLSAPLKNDLVNITKEVSKMERRESAERNYKKRLLDTIDKTLPSTPNLSQERRSSFENMKENLADAFVSFFRNTNGNMTEYKDNIKEEINKFCNDYLKRYPSTPIDPETLSQNLYAALQNVPLPPANEHKSFDSAPNIETEIERCLAGLPLKDTETNNLLKKQFVDFVQSSARDPQIQSETYENLEKRIMEKLNQFSFESENIPNINQVSKKIVNLIKNSRTSKCQITITSDRRRTESLRRTSQGLSSEQTEAPCLDHHEPIYECVPYCINIGNQTEPTPGCSFIARNRVNCDALTSTKHRSCHVSGNFSNRSNRKALSKRKKTQGAQTSKVCEIPPCIIVKQYYWDGHAPCQVNGSLQELQNAQYEPRRTVPSLPLTQTSVPCTPTDPPTGHCRAARRPCVHSPCRSHMSMMDPNFTTLPAPMEHQAVEEELWATTKQCPNINYRNKQSNINLTQNANVPESFISRTTSECRTQRRRICNEPYTTCSNARIQDINRCNNCYPQDFVEYANGIRSVNDQSPGPDAGMMRENVDRKVECRCCGPINENFTCPAPATNRIMSRQCTSGANQCINCCRTPCLRPSYVYFS